MSTLTTALQDLEVGWDAALFGLRVGSHAVFHLNVKSLALHGRSSKSSVFLSLCNFFWPLLGQRVRHIFDEVVQQIRDFSELP